MTADVEKRQFFRHSKINSYEVDVNRIVRPSGVIKELQEAAYEQMEAQKPSYDDLLKEGKALMIARMDLEITEELRLNDEIVTSSWPCRGSRATLPRCYALWRGGKLAARAASQWVIADLESRKILKVDSLDVSRYFIGEYCDIYDQKLAFSKQEQEGFERVGTKTVRYSDLDYNGHMNNTYYPDMLCDCIPELAAGTHRVGAIRLHYAKEAVLGDVIEIKMACPEPGKYAFRTFKTGALSSLRDGGEIAGESLRKSTPELAAKDFQELNRELNLQAELSLVSLT